MSKELPKVIYVMGPPGAGKGTQAEMLAQKIGYHRFSTGDAFRAISREDSDLGRKVKNTIDNGYLAPPEMAADVVISAIKKSMDAKQGLIFDGTPRTVREAELVDEFFLRNGYGRPMAIYLKVDKGDMIERNSKRRFCLGIAGDFPVMTQEDEERCASLGGHIGTRPDDDPDKFITRWQEFKSQTYPVIEKYKAEGIGYELNGKGTVEDIHAGIMNIVDAFTRDGSS